MSVTPIKELKDFDRKYEAKHLLLESLQTWGEKYVKWHESKFSELDVEQMVKEIKDYDSKSEKLKIELSKGEKKDAVVEKLYNEVKNVVAILGIIESIGNKALKPKHWKKIFGYLENAGALSPERFFTLKELLAWQIVRYEDQIKEIAATAQGEFTIETIL